MLSVSLPGVILSAAKDLLGSAWTQFVPGAVGIVGHQLGTVTTQ